MLNFQAVDSPGDQTLEVIKVDASEMKPELVDSVEEAATASVKTEVCEIA
jgi:hypothetical protein